jgi:hypothetical protein
MATTYYEYVHSPGYGRDDHRADELIARAARHLGAAGASAHVITALGLVSHGVPMGAASIRVPAGRGVRQRMLRAIRAAFVECRQPSCAIGVRCYRERWTTDRGARYRVTEERCGRHWIECERTAERDGAGR